MCCCLNGIHVPPLDGWDVSASGLLLHVFCYVAARAFPLNVGVLAVSAFAAAHTRVGERVGQRALSLSPSEGAAILDPGCSPELFAPRRWFSFVLFLFQRFTSISASDLFKTKPPPKLVLWASSASVCPSLTLNCLFGSLQISILRRYKLPWLNTKRRRWRSPCPPSAAPLTCSLPLKPAHHQVGREAAQSYRWAFSYKHLELHFSHFAFFFLPRLLVRL